MRDRVQAAARWRLRRGLGLGVVALLAVLLSSPLGGQAPPVQAQAQGKHTFTTCGARSSSLTIPPNSYVEIEVQGGAGHHGSDAGTAYGGDGGHGAVVEGVLLPTHEERQLTIYVGCAGGPADDSPRGQGYTSGGVGGFAHHLYAGSGAGGGGSSAVVLKGIGPILVAGGGGGGGGGGRHSAADTGGAGGHAGASPEAGTNGGADNGGAGSCGGCVQQVGGDPTSRAGHGGGTDNLGGGGGGGGGGYCVPGLHCQGEDGGGGGQGAFGSDGGGGGGGAGNSFIYAASWLVATRIGTSTGTGHGQVAVSWSSREPGVPAPDPTPAPMTIRGQLQRVVPPLVSEGQIEHSLTPHVGAQVEALVGSTVCGTAVTDADGRFTLRVAPHPTTPGCGQPGATIRFRIDGSEYPETVPFQSGGTAAVALRSSEAPFVPRPRWP